MIAEASGSFAYIIVPIMLRCDIVHARNTYGDCIFGQKIGF